MSRIRKALIRLSPRTQQRAYMAGEQAMAKRAWPTAGKLWQDYIDRYGKKAPQGAWINLSNSLRQQGRFARAEKTIARALKQFGDTLGLRNEQAEIAHSQSDWPEAAKRWQKIIKDFPDQKKLAPAYVRLSEAYTRQAEFDKAEAVMTEATQHHPRHQFVRVAHARIPSDRQLWPEAIKRWEALIKDLGHKAPAAAWANLGGTYRKANQLDEAEAALKRGLATRPNDFEIRLVLGEVMIDKEDWKQALPLWQGLLRDMPVGESLSRVRIYARMNVSFLKRLAKLNDYRASIRQYAKRPKPKVAIYTSYTGDYDELKLPEIVDKRFDYFVFTDESVDGRGVYQVRKLNQPDLVDDGSRASRYPKTHPHVLFKNYDVAIWVDTSLMIVGDLMPIIERFLASGLPLGNPTHPQRESLMEEFEACIDLKKDDPAILKKQAAFYKSIGFETKDLANNGVIFFNLKHKKLAPVMETWWGQVLKFSKRDQLSMNYSLFVNKAERYRLTKPPIDIRDHKHFIFVPHHSEYKLVKRFNQLVKP